MSQSVTRIGKVGVLGHLDELERLMQEYIAWVSEGVGEDAGLTRQLALSSFLEWLRQRQRQSAAGDSGGRKRRSRFKGCEHGAFRLLLRGW